MDSGGAATNTLLGMDGVRRHGFDSTLVYGRTLDKDGRIAEDITRLGIPALTLPSLVRHVSPVRDVQALIALYRVMKKGKYALVHTHTSKAGALGRMAARFLRKPVVHTAHGHIFYGYFGPLQTSVYTCAERVLATWSNALVSLTEDETTESLRRGIGRPDRFHTIPSGVPLARFMEVNRAAGQEQRRRLGVQADDVLFVSVGRLVPVKGFDRLLQAFADYRAAGRKGCLAIVGDGPERPALEAAAARLGVTPHVLFTGHMDDVRPALAAADVFVLASRNEGMGRVIVEAMAAGLPVIATAVGGIVSLLRSGNSGILITNGDVASFSAAMQELTTDVRRRLEMGETARREVYPDYDLETMSAQLASLYRSVLRHERTQGR